MSVLWVDEVSKVYGSGHTEVRAVDHVSLSLEVGDIVLVMGPSGSGKTTLLTMIGGLLRPTKGKIEIDSRRIDREQPPSPAWRRGEIGFIFQDFNLLSALTAEQNVMVPLLASGVKKSQSRQRSRELLEGLGLSERLHYLPKNLSGGEKQRVAIARALVNNPKLLLADEPTANLDSKIGHEVAKLLCEIACGEGRAVVIVSHDPRLRDVAKRVITIEDGRLTKEESGNHEQFCPHHQRNS